MRFGWFLTGTFRKSSTIPSDWTWMTYPTFPGLRTPTDSRPDPDGSKLNAVTGVWDPSPVAMPVHVPASRGLEGLLKS